MKNLTLIYLIVLPFIFSSCEEWFDVSPSSEVKADVLFSSEEGFNDALVGAYTNLTQHSLYGGNSNMLLLDVLANEYHNIEELGVGSPYYYAHLYDYNHSSVQPKINSIWSEKYSIVANCNSLLNQIDSKKSIFTSSNYQVIKAEALALRAMMHFDLLRLFGPIYDLGSDQMAIPYVDQFGVEVFPQLTAAIVIEKIVTDLSESKKLLLESDPIIPDVETPSGSLLLPRTGRLNYYAVTGLLARVYLYSNDKPNALIAAKEVIESELFELADYNTVQNILESEKSRTLTKEHLFAIDKFDLEDLFDKYYDPNLVSTDNNALRFNKNIIDDEIYELGGSITPDFRKDLWFTDIDQSTSAFTKYQYGNDVPLLKVSEMYLIASECTADDTEALFYLNELRYHRGLEDLSEMSLSEINDEIAKEYRKEFQGEGQLFYFYKRNMYQQLPGLAEFSDIKAVYVLPIPDDEYTFGNINE
ncbi:MAG: RagB/SusD family nutrient uptake outer membrane protein [Carboxylicivirga sp.]|jgi:hypothetical protein|nr:RagB/SusD family nutrient uptake outer membrane protein [Carboxylicivirga sp.]